MGKILKKGKVVILTTGRHAGKKAIIVKTYDEGHKSRKFPCALVTGLAEQPRKVTSAMGKKKIESKVNKLKPFVKYVNFVHVMPTRYQVDLDFKDIITGDEVTTDQKKALKKVFVDRYLNQSEAKSDKAFNGAKFFYQKLRF